MENINFNLEKYIAYQKELKQRLKNGEISFIEYADLTSLKDEKQKLTEMVENIKIWIEENNLPFSIEYCFLNIQVLLDASDALTNDFFGSFLG